jgi:ABC-type phosphate transport system auxiliary subunit
MNEFFILAFFMIVVGIPVIGGLGADIYKRRLRFQERQLEIMGAQTVEKAAQYAAQIERLEQRVRVLERIITDHGGALSAEIETLRDAPLN